MIKESWPTFEDILTAYQSCRLHKISSIQQVRFEYKLSENILKIHNEIHSLTYSPSISKCFILTKPRSREIFAAHFRDRIIHHLIVSKLEPPWERKFSYSSFACRKGKGNHAAIKQLQKYARSASHGGIKEVFILKLDVQTFFASIDRMLLKNLMLQNIHDDKLNFLIEVTLNHDPRKNVHMASPFNSYNLISHNKSWFNRGPSKGLPIGNLTSQFGANVYCNDIDHYIKRTLKSKFYIRYVDDFIFLSNNPEELAPLIKKIGDYILKTRGLTLNKDKTLLKSLKQGVEYLGYILKQARNPKNPIQLFTPSKKKNELIMEANQVQRSGIPPAQFEHPLSIQRSTKKQELLFSSLNARLGSLNHGNSFILRKKTILKLQKSLALKDFNLYGNWKRLKIKGDFTSVKLK